MVAGICPRKLFAYIRIRLNSREEEALEHTRSRLGIDEYGLMHEDDSRLPSREKKNDARCVRGYTRTDPLPRRRDKTSLGEECARRGTTGGDSWKRRNGSPQTRELFLRTITHLIVRQIYLTIITVYRNSIRIILQVRYHSFKRRSIWMLVNFLPINISDAETIILIVCACKFFMRTYFGHKDWKKNYSEPVSC